MDGMASNTDGQQFIELLSGSFTIDEENADRPVRYSHVTAPPIPDGAVGVPQLVVSFLTATDGAELYCSDDEQLKEWGIPLYAAILYDREQIDYWTTNLRDQLIAELESWRNEGGVSEQRASALIDETSRYWVIGATVNGDSFVVETATATTIRIWPHATLLAPFIDPEDDSEAPRVDGLVGLMAWLETQIQ